MGVFILKMNYEEPSSALLESAFQHKSCTIKCCSLNYSCRSCLDAALVGDVSPYLKTCKIHNAQKGAGPKHNVYLEIFQLQKWF